MASCENCWEEAGGSPTRYAELIKIRKCTPEEQAGRDARQCPKCGRKTLHQIVNVCMVPECDYREVEKPAPPAPGEEERGEMAEVVLRACVYCGDCPYRTTCLTTDRKSPECKANEILSKIRALILAPKVSREWVESKARWLLREFGGERNLPAFCEALIALYRGAGVEVIEKP
ncbi:MAG: hypothetical protein IMZ62_15995 [Chloroflexi bacterium]|nr:hypothetical protein [Chloroflexota bacterium]